MSLTTPFDALVSRGKRHDITAFNAEAINANFEQLFRDVQAIVTALRASAATPIAEADVTGLVADLAARGVIPIAESDVTGLVTDLAAKATTAAVTAALALKAPIASPTFTGTVTLAADPASALQAATKAYVDSLDVNLGKRARVRASTTATITIATALNNGDVLDGVTLATNDLVLVKDQSTPAQNGIYVVGVTPARTPEFDTYDEHPGSIIVVEEGTLGADVIWLCTSNVGGTLNTTALAFAHLAAPGNVTNTGAAGSEPASPIAGDLYLANNGLTLERYSGSAWARFGPIFPLTTPIDAQFAWVNQGGATVTVTADGIYFLAPAAAAEAIRLRKKAAPATPYTITIGFLPHMYDLPQHNMGLAFRESSSGKLHTFTLQANSGGVGGGFFSYKWTSPTVYSAQYDLVYNQRGAGIIWMQIADDGTNRICSAGIDPEHFIPLFSIGRTNFLTADEVGFYVETDNLVVPCAMHLLSWKEA